MRRLLLIIAAVAVARAQTSDRASLETALEDVKAYDMDVADLLALPHHEVMEDFAKMVHTYRLGIEDMLVNEAGNI